MSALPPAATGSVTVTTMVEVPPTAMVPPAKVHVISDEAVVQVQFVPVADTNVRLEGSWSLT